MSAADARAVELVSGAAVPALLDDLHDAAERLWHDVPQVPLADRIRFETALIEVGSNIVRHGIPVGDSVNVTAELSASAVCLEAELSDDGAEADFEMNPSVPDDAATSGRGLLLIQRTVDLFTFTREADRNVWHLVRRYGPA